MSIGGCSQATFIFNQRKLHAHPVRKKSIIGNHLKRLLIIQVQGLVYQSQENGANQWSGGVIN
jgi:hypothetical protein